MCETWSEQQWAEGLRLALKCVTELPAAYSSFLQGSYQTCCANSSSLCSRCQSDQQTINLIEETSKLTTYLQDYVKEAEHLTLADWHMLVQKEQVGCLQQQSGLSIAAQQTSSSAQST